MNATAKKTTNRTPEEKAKRAEAERARRAAKKAQAQGGMQAAPTFRDVEIDGKTVKVAAGLSDAEAKKVARQLLAGAAKPVEEPGVLPAPSRSKKPAAPAGSVVVRLSGQTLYAIEEVGSFEAQAPTAIAAVRKGETKKMGNGTTTVAVLTIADAKLLAKHVSKVAKEWSGPKSKPKDRDGNQPVSLFRAVRNIEKAIKEASA